MHVTLSVFFFILEEIMFKNYSFLHDSKTVTDLQNTSM